MKHDFKHWMLLMEAGETTRATRFKIGRQKQTASTAELEQMIPDAVAKRDWPTAIRAFKQLYGGSFAAFWNQYSTRDKADEAAAKAAFARFRRN